MEAAIVEAATVPAAVPATVPAAGAATMVVCVAGRGGLVRADGHGEIPPPPPWPRSTAGPNGLWTGLAAGELTSAVIALIILKLMDPVPLMPDNKGHVRTLP